LGEGELREDSPELNGVSESVELLSSLDLEESIQNSTLLWTFSPWIFDKWPNEAIKVVDREIKRKERNRDCLLNVSLKMFDCLL
jgi:hypothetical protein